MDHPDDESMRGNCPQELGIIQLDVWHVDSFDVDDISEDSHKDNDNDSADEVEVEDDSDPKHRPVHEYDAKAKGTELRIVCVFSPCVEDGELM